MGMRNFTIRGGLVVAAAGLLWSTASVSAREAEVRLVPECELTVGVERVRIQAEPVTVPVSHSVALGEKVTAALDEESGAIVASVARDADDAPMTLRLVVNTSEASAGEWAITLGDGEQVCSGSVTIVAAEPSL